MSSMMASYYIARFLVADPEESVLVRSLWTRSEEKIAL